MTIELTLHIEIRTIARAAGDLIEAVWAIGREPMILNS